MSEKTAYLIGPDGKVVASSPEDTAINLATGYLPASPKQIADFQKEEAYQAKYGTTGQQLATFAEGAAQPLTFGLSTALERAAGVPKEDIKAREEVNPKSHIAGTIAGVAAPLVLSGGATGIGEAAELTAPSLIARAGEGVGELLPEAAAATTGLGRLGLSVAKGATTAGTEGALYGAGHVVHEAALGDPNLTAQSALEEVGLSGLFGVGVGAAGGTLSGLTRELTGGQLGEKLADWAHRFEGNRNLSSAAGGRGVASLVRKDAQRLGFENLNQLAREGGDLGLVDTFSTPAKTLSRADELMESSGRQMGEILDSTDATGAAPKALEDIAARVRKDVLSKMEASPFKEASAEKIATKLAGYEERFAGRGEEAGMTFRDLHTIRKDISDELYGLRGNMDPGATFYKSGLHDVRTIVSDEITKGLEDAGVDSAAWKAANRKYQVAATFSKYAEKGLASELGWNLLPLTSVLSGGAGLIAGGPAGGVALGLAGLLAKKYGSGLLATTARYLRNTIEKGAAESVVNKTADLIATERAEAGAGAASQASRVAEAWNHAVERVEPLGAPIKDVSREQLKERIAGQSTAEPERLAALSQLAKANRAVAKRVDDLAASVVTGKRVPRGVLEEEFSKLSHKAHEEQLDEIHQLAGNPSLLQTRLMAQSSDVHEHAPNTAQALGLASVRAVTYMHAKFPKEPKAAPLAPKLKPSGAELRQLHQTKSLLKQPSLLLKHTANSTLTPGMVEAVATVYPERLQQMQQAVLQKIAEHGEKTIPYRQRLMLGMLFGQSMDGTTTPQSIQAAQLAYSLPSAKSPENQTGGGRRSTQGGLAKLEVASQMRLPGQSADARRREV